jgi:large subunit ribosomal protein L24
MAGKSANAGKSTNVAKAKGMKIKKGDHVIVIAGKDKGREGTVVKADPESQRVLVHGVSMIKKNTKVNYQGGRGGRSYKEGGIVNQEALIHVSNVSLVDPDTKKPAKAGYRAGEAKEGEDAKKKVRFSRASGKEL